MSRITIALTVALAAITLSACSPNAIEAGINGESDVFTLEVGDCISGEADTSGEAVSTVPVVDCAEPHLYEVYSNRTVAGEDYPGDDAIATQADAECLAEFAAFVGLEYDASALAITYYTPTEDSWNSGDRTINCVITDPAGDVTGSLAGAAR